VITIPTGDLVGVLADVVLFAFPKADLPGINCVRLEWDGGMLHALATDKIRAGISSWHPTDEPDDDGQDDLFAKWGGADDPWSLLLPLDDAKDLVANYKLGPKEYRVPLTIDVHDNVLKVERSRDTGHSRIVMQIEGQFVDFPDLRKLLAAADQVRSVRGQRYTARMLADFAKVRPRGPFEMTFAKGLTHITIGERFVGAIAPMSDDKDAPEPVAA
jgi:hypothetical protein